MSIYRTAIKRIACGVLMGAWAAPNPAIADGNCAAITGTGEIAAIAFPNWPSAEPFASLTGTAVVHIDGGQTMTLAVSGEITDVMIPDDDDDFDSLPTAWVTVAFELDGVGSFGAEGEAVVTLPETTNLDGVFPVDAELNITSGTGDFARTSGTIVSAGQNDFFAGAGTFELNGNICLRTVCHIPPGRPEKAHTIHVGPKAVSAHLEHGDYLGPCAPDAAALKRMPQETGERGSPAIGCGAFSPAILLLVMVTLCLMRLTSARPQARGG